ncbi:MAG TPA: pseudouridine synthase [Ktedonobacteraceae bacterium]|nr:pseudouridine synthase [Ktedonobacteraceae bacterium]
MVQEQDSSERLSRFLAHAGIASRRRAEELIAAGRVQVNGVKVTVQGTRINPDTDLVLVDNKPVRTTSKRVYLLLHKPVGYVSTARDPQGRPTVLNLLPPELHALRVYPVGRLDIDTSGLLLLTNDGDFALHLTHPRYSMQKHYHALVKGYPSESSLQALRNGVTIVEDQGRSHITAPAEVRVLRREGSDCWLSLSIHEGRKRQVRRMLAAVGHPVLELSRVGIGPLNLGDLPAGRWRNLTEDEVHALESYSHAL